MHLAVVTGCEPFGEAIGRLFGALGRGEASAHEAEAESGLNDALGEGFSGRGNKRRRFLVTRAETLW